MTGDFPLDSRPFITTAGGGTYSSISSSVMLSMCKVYKLYLFCILYVDFLPSLPSRLFVLYDGGSNGGFSSFKIIGDLLPISGFSSSSSWKITGIPFDRNERRSSSSPINRKVEIIFLRNLKN